MQDAVVKVGVENSWIEDAIHRHSIECGTGEGWEVGEASSVHRSPAGQIVCCWRRL